MVYDCQEAAPSGNPALYAAVDSGVDNLAALTSNKKGFVPRLVNGRPIKSTNQYYNKRKAELQAALGHEGTTARVERFTAKRTRRITHYLQTASKAIIALLVAEGIGHWHAGGGQKPWLETGSRVRAREQSALRWLATCPLYLHGGIQGEARRHPLCVARRKLHQQGLIP